MKASRLSAFTWVEALVALSIFAFLIALSLPFILYPPDGHSRTRTLSNLQQLHLATQQMALDGTTTGDTNLGWPGDTGGTFTNWTRQLVTNGYLSTNDFCKLLSAPDWKVPLGALPSGNTNAILAYAVSTNSPSDAVFLTTANFTNTPKGGAPLRAYAKPFGNKCFIVFRQGGDGAILLKDQVTNTNLIGSFVPLLR